MLFRVISLLVLGLLYGCEQPTWDGFVYPDRNNLFNYSNIGEFESLEKCRIASKDELKRLRAEEVGLYQCGKDCITSTGLHTVAACKEITR
ncbi:MAG: hypothetical protein HRT87_09740 [Legionellales bacterium]|nr:hypothetical protein [Legionellales bacterium]